MKKYLLSLFTALVTLVASAQTKVEIDGIWYDLYSEPLQAEVTFKGNSYDSYINEYSGSITIPATITYEGADYSVTSIGAVAFYECTSLTAVTIPESVTSIKGNAFYGCTNLTSVTIPATTTYEGGSSIGTSAFGSCSSLKAITIPDWVTGLEYAAFSGCSSLTSVTIPENSRLTWMDECVFEGCNNLTSITLPESLTSIDNYAFYRCSSLATVTIPENSQLTSIGDDVFRDCSNLISITIPQKVTELRKALFNYCYSLTSVIIPHGVTSIGDYVFWDCHNLKGITCNAATPPTISSASTFYNVDRSIPIYVPAGSVEDYRNAKYWSEFTNIQAIPNEFTLTITAAGYATMFLDYAVAIPEGVEVFYASSVEGDRMKMTRVTGVLPANTGVIVGAAKGDYTFTEIEGEYDAIEGNLLMGTTTKTLITTESGYAYYVLANTEGVAMYKPMLNNGQFYNNANKAYLKFKVGNLGIFDDEVDTDEEGRQLSNSLRFDFGGTTSIQNSQFTIDNSQFIYDLRGCKVTDTEGLKGIYIVNGRKVVIK